MNVTMMDSDKNYICLRFAKGGIFKCAVLKHPSRGTPADYIKMEWRASGEKGRRGYVVLRDDEAFMWIRLLAWALDRRMGSEYIQIRKKKVV